VVTNLRGANAPSVADHALALVLGLARRPHRYERPAHAIALEGKTLLVVGLGEIGSRVAARAKGFGMIVRATQRHPKPAADIIVITVPLTDETRHLFDAKLLALAKPTAYLVNVGRGEIVDTEALVAALKAGKLAGAGLDVTDPEPLPDKHPLRQLPNVLVTPHIAADSDLTEQRSWEFFRDNLRHFAAGEKLEHTVDVAAGY
jgi:phosphoglycerate dehydrogenase-like enzyme